VPIAPVCMDIRTLVIFGGREIVVDTGQHAHLVSMCKFRCGFLHQEEVHEIPSVCVMRHGSRDAHRSSEGFTVGSSHSRSEVGSHKGISSQGYHCNPSLRGCVTLDRSLCSTEAMEQLYGCSARQEV
jgi:hypothetical protein